MTLHSKLTLKKDALVKPRIQCALMQGWPRQNEATHIFFKVNFILKIHRHSPVLHQVLYEHSHCDEDHQGVSKPETLDDQPGLLTSPDS